MEFRFETEFIKDADRFTYIHVIAVSVVAFIRNVFDFAEARTVNGRETIGQAFRRRTVQRKSQTGLFLPGIDRFAQTVHQARGKRMTFFAGMRFAGDEFGRFIHPDVAEGKRGIGILQVRINLFTRFEAGNRAILPMNRRHVAHDIFQEVIAQHQCFVAKLQAFFQDFKEFFFRMFRQNTDLRQVQRNDALIEATVPNVFAFFVFIRAQEGAAAHR